ncbi:MAG TPA: aldose epimerase family protein [Polyangiaceae bacterium]
MRTSVNFRQFLTLLALAPGLAHCGGSQAKTPEQPSAPSAASVVPPAPAAQPPTPISAAEAAKPARTESITKSDFGTVEGKTADLYTLRNANGLVMKVTNYGATITVLSVPDRAGKFGDIVAGFDDLAGYLKKSPYFGAAIGRYENRIKNGRFQLEGKAYQQATNDPPHHLHGGTKGWDKVVWDTVAATDTPQGPTIKFSYLSKDGEEGYPGNVSAFVTYTLTNDNELRITLQASTDKTTLVNMAQHNYWNLGGYDSGTITDHELTLYADKYTPGDPFVPNGVIKAVKGTPFDFTKAKPIGKDLASVHIKGIPVGYDHNFVINGDPHSMRPVARVKDPKSGRVMTLEGDQPGLQFYSGNFLDGTITGKGHTYKQYEAFVLETQKFPNSINVPAWSNEAILKPGQAYEHHMIYRFSAE